MGGSRYRRCNYMWPPTSKRGLWNNCMALSVIIPIWYRQKRCPSPLSHTRCTLIAPIWNFGSLTDDQQNHAILVSIIRSLHLNVFINYGCHSLTTNLIDHRISWQLTSQESMEGCAPDARNNRETNKSKHKRQLWLPLASQTLPYALTQRARMRLD